MWKFQISTAAIRAQRQGLNNKTLTQKLSARGGEFLLWSRVEVAEVESASERYNKTSLQSNSLFWCLSRWPQEQTKWPAAEPLHLNICARQHRYPVRWLCHPTKHIRRQLRGCRITRKRMRVASHLPLQSKDLPVLHCLHVSVYRIFKKILHFYSARIITISRRNPSPPGKEKCLI